MLKYSITSSKIWIEKEWPKDWISSIFLPFPNKGDTQQCSSSRAAALIRYNNKILLKINAGKMKTKLGEDIADEPAGFRTGIDTRNRNLNVKMRKKEIFISFFL